MLAEFYAKSIHDKFKYFAAWQPHTTFQLGDVGILDGSVFVYQSNLKLLGIDFETKKSATKGELDLVTDANTVIKTKLAGEFSPNIPGLTQGEAGFALSFKDEQSVFMKIEGAQTSVIADQLALKAEIERRFNHPTADKKWDKKWVVITELVKGDSGTIIVSKGKNASISVRAKAVAGGEKINLVDADAQFEVTTERSIGAKAIAQEGIAPIFKLQGIKRRFLGFGAGELSARGGSEATEGIFEEIDFPSTTAPATLNIDNVTTGKTIRVFSVGINKYKSDEISNLHGCIEDVQKLKRFLQAELGIADQDYKVLTNQYASRQGIIDTFRNHFKNLKDGDIALFHFSGHGSFEQASQEFVDAGLEVAGGRNEVLVCHDSKTGSIYNIADKELRWLISELQYPVGEAVKNIHFTCLFDCCHSGSMLRSESGEISVRRYAGSTAQRPLHAYLEGQYEQLQSIQLPPVNYISLTACSPRQSAIEDANGGLFTHALVSALSRGAKGGNLPSYNQLYTLLREAVRNNANNHQTPYFEYAGSVNPYHAFLLQGESAGNSYPELIRKENEWRINMGAIHGLDTASLQEMKIPVYPLDKQDNPIGYLYIGEVDLEHANVREIVLDPPYQAELNPVVTRGGASESSTYKTYLVGLNAYRLPLKMSCEAIALPIKEILLKELKKSKNKGLVSLDNNATYELAIYPDRILILRNFPHQHELIFGVRQTNEQAVQHIIEQLRQIARWEQFNSIQAPKNSLVDPGLIDLSFSYKEENGQEQVIRFSANEERGSKSFQATIPRKRGQDPSAYSIAVQNNTSSQLFYYLVHLGEGFWIKQKNELYNKASLTQESIVLYDSNSYGVGMGIPKGQKEILHTLLLIASKKELGFPFVFEQDGLGKDYGKIIDHLPIREKEQKGSNLRDIPLTGEMRANWAVKRMEIKLVLGE